MQLGRVPGAERCRDSALCIRRRAVEQRALGEQQHRSLLGRPPRGVQAGDAGADDEEACADAVDGHGL